MPEKSGMASGKSGNGVGICSRIKKSRSQMLLAAAVS